MVNLLDFRSDKYSTTGNDGIIEYIFKTLEIEKGFFVEFGAWDGIVGSNCRKLFEEGWTGVFIEADSKRFLDLRKNYQGEMGITCLNSKIDFDNNRFDDVIAYWTDIDFCSIDIDGMDVEVFETFQKYLPKVVCIEGGQMLPPSHGRIPLKKARNNIQQSLSVMVDVFALKGYKPLCSYQDTFFVKNELYDRFDVTSSLMDMYLDGLVAHARRIPWIQKILKANKLKNPILTEILSISNFAKYDYAKRKKWAVAEKATIERAIEDIRRRDD